MRKNKRKEKSIVVSRNLIHLVVPPTFCLGRRPCSSWAWRLKRLTSVYHTHAPPPPAEYAVDHGHELSTFHHGLECITSCYTCIIHSRPWWNVCLLECLSIRAYLVYVLYLFRHTAQYSNILHGLADTSPVARWKRFFGNVDATLIIAFYQRNQFLPSCIVYVNFTLAIRALLLLNYMFNLSLI